MFATDRVCSQGQFEGSGRIEGGVRVCSLVRYPKQIRPGTVNGDFLTSLELFPTLLKLAGVAPPEGVVLDGFDMMPMLAEGKPSPRKEMYWKLRAREAARVENWKWIRNERGTFLFDLSKDAGETNNLIDKMPEKAAQMQQHFENWMKRMDEAAAEAAQAEAEAAGGGAPPSAVS